VYHSQVGQDRILNEEVFKNARGGVFCDVGAHDGVTYSNSCFFERQLGWTGIAVEALADEFEKLKLARSCVCVHGAAFNRSGTIDFRRQFAPSASFRHSGEATMTSGVEECYHPSHRARLAKERAMAGPAASSLVSPVKCFPLATLFEEHAIETVDYLSVDTEGSESQVLEGIDFSKVHVNVVNFEANYRESAEHGLTQLALARAGFNFLRRIEFDDVWTNSDVRWSWD
jgi:FkbM family methyltransferase